MSNSVNSQKTLVIGGIILGAGLAGFFDGIVFHQILGWHHLVCVTEHCEPMSVEHLQRQNTQDGCFHLFVFVLTIVGSYLVFLAAVRSPVRYTSAHFFGAILYGTGLFNSIEGLVAHQTFGIHHVLPGSPFQLYADIAFIASGLVMIAVGYLLTRELRSPRSVQRSLH